MKHSFSIITKIIPIILSVIFLFQTFTKVSIIPLDTVLKFFGIGNNVVDLVFTIFYLALFIVFLSILLSILNHFKIVKVSTKERLYLTLLVRVFMMFLIFFPTWISFSILGGTGLLGSDIYYMLGHTKTLSEVDQVTFMNLYLFWFFLINSFIKPQILVSKNSKDQIGYI
jgi:hypothetical protein